MYEECVTEGCSRLSKHRTETLFSQRKSSDVFMMDSRHLVKKLRETKDLSERCTLRDMIKRLRADKSTLNKERMDSICDPSAEIVAAVTQGDNESFQRHSISTTNEMLIITSEQRALISKLMSAKSDDRREKIRSTIKELRRQLEQNCPNELDRKSLKPRVNGVTDGVACTKTSKSFRHKLNNVDKEDCGVYRGCALWRPPLLKSLSESCCKDRHHSDSSQKFVSLSSAVFDIDKTSTRPRRKISTITSPDIYSLEVSVGKNCSIGKVSQVTEDMADMSTFETHSHDNIMSVNTQEASQNGIIHDLHGGSYATQLEKHSKLSSKIFNRTLSNNNISLNCRSDKTLRDSSEKEFTSLLSGFSDDSLEMQNSNEGSGIEHDEKKQIDSILNNNSYQHYTTHGFSSNQTTNGNLKNSSTIKSDPIRKTSGIGTKIDNLISNVSAMESRLDNMFETIFSGIERQKIMDHNTGDSQINDQLYQNLKSQETKMDEMNGGNNSDSTDEMISGEQSPPNSELSSDGVQNSDGISSSQSPSISLDGELQLDLGRPEESSLPYHAPITAKLSSSSVTSQCSESSSNAVQEGLISPGSDDSFMSTNSNFELSESDLPFSETLEEPKKCNKIMKSSMTFNFWPETDITSKTGSGDCETSNESTKVADSHAEDKDINDIIKRNKNETEVGLYKSEFNMSSVNGSSKVFAKKTDAMDEDKPEDRPKDSTEITSLTDLTESSDEEVITTTEVVYINGPQSTRYGTESDQKISNTATDISDMDRDASISNHLPGDGKISDAKLDSSSGDEEHEVGENRKLDQLDASGIEQMFKPDVQKVERTSDGSITVTNVHEYDKGRKTITVRSKAHRTESMSELHEKDTTVVTDVTSPAGTKFQEIDRISSYRKLTPKGSMYFKSNTMRSKYMEQTDGQIGEEHAILTESQNKSASTGQSWGDTKLTKMVIDKESGHTNEGTTNKTLSGLPEILQPLVNCGYTAGETAILMCCVCDNTCDVDVFWYRDTTLLLPSDKFCMTLTGNNAELIIRDTNLSDTNIYSCVFRNVQGSAETKCRVTITDDSTNTDTDSLDISGTSDTESILSGNCSLTPPNVSNSPSSTVMSPMTELPPPTTPDVAMAKLNLFRFLRRLTSEDSPTNSAPTSPVPTSPVNNFLPQNDISDSERSIQRSCSGNEIVRQPTNEVTNEVTRPISAVDGVTLRSKSVASRPRRSNTWCSSDPGWNRELGSIKEGEAQTEITRTPSFTMKQTYSPQICATNDANRQSTNHKSKVSPLCYDANKDKKNISEECNKNDEDITGGLIVGDFADNDVSHRHSDETKTIQPTQENDTDKNDQENNVQITANHTSSKVSYLATRLQSRLSEGLNDEKSGAKLYRRHTTKEISKEPVPVVASQRAPSPETCFYSGPPTMSTPLEEITDDELLYKMLSATDNLDERRKIRGRIKEIRAKSMQELEARRRASVDQVKQRMLDQEELKRKKMERYAEIAAAKPTCENFANVKQRHATNTQSKTNQDGSRTVTTTTTTEKSQNDGSKVLSTKKTESTSVTKLSGFGGTQYTAPKADVLAERLATRIQNDINGSSRGKITVKTETWNNKDGLVQKSETTQRWGATRPQGPRSAMAAFKQMDAKTTPQSPNSLSAGGPGGGGGSSGRVVRSPSAIKQVLLDWCSAMTREYENVNITNFSSCWNNGLGFCALIHHFYPDAFDYDQLKPENRRYNFTLAFDTAEKCADIAPLLDVEDMVMMKKPDWKCVFTYVQSMYRHLRDHQNNKAIVPPPS